MSEAHSQLQDRPWRRYTPEVLAAIPGWRAAGASREEIASVLGVSVNSLQVTCSREGISLRSPLREALGPTLWAQLRKEAERRKTTVPGLVSDVMRAVVGDNLFAGVLGDYDDLDVKE